MCRVQDMRLKRQTRHTGGPRHPFHPPADAAFPLLSLHACHTQDNMRHTQDNMRHEEKASANPCESKDIEEKEKLSRNLSCKTPQHTSAYVSIRMLTYAATRISLNCLSAPSTPCCILWQEVCEWKTSRGVRGRPRGGLVAVGQSKDESTSV
jgi:hypothetical protein